MEIDWKILLPAIGAFAGGIFGSLMIDGFKELLRKFGRHERMAGELFTCRLEAYRELSAAIYRLKPDGTTDEIRSILEKHLPIISDVVLKAFNRIFEMIDGKLTKTVDGYRVVLPEPVDKVELAQSYGELLNTMRADLSIARLDEGLDAILNRVIKNRPENAAQGGR